MQATEARVGDEPGTAAVSSAWYSPRIERLREHLLSSPFEGDIERARYYTRSYKETEGEPPCMRAAKALRETLRNLSITIGADEYLVGAKTIKTVAAPLGIERTFVDRVNLVGLPFHGRDPSAIEWLNAAHGGGPTWLKELLKMPEEAVREMKDEINPYWRGKNLSSLMRARWAELGLTSEPQRATRVAGAADMQGHVSAGLKKVLDMGFNGIARQAAERLERLKPSDDRYEEREDFLKAVQVATLAAGEFAERYASLAGSMARDASPARRAELLAIADRCRRVPSSPPRSFIEAVQSIWMTQAVLAISYGEDSIFAPGRVDQYLNPYYLCDLDIGRITPGVALETIEEYLIKLSTFVGFGPNNITIGGIDKHGAIAVNEVSYQILDAYHRLKGLRNGLAVRIADDTPRDFLIKACATHKRTAGVAFYSDNVVIRDLMRDGYSLEDARDYCVIGCAELTSTGNNNGYTSGASCHFEAVLEMALNEGRRYAYNWEPAGVKTPPARDMKTFDDVKRAVVVQLANSVDKMVQLVNVKDRIFAESFPTPLLSSTIEGCIESGHDVTRGGAKYNHGSVSAHGVGLLANSLAAIRYAVFEEKLVTLEELVGHLRNNFEGAEELRQRMMRKAPKYGNNDPKADELVVWALELLDKESRKHKRPIDSGTYRGLMISAGGQVLAGRAIGATPDGRLAREPVSNGMSPVNGTDREGITAVLHSAAKASAPPLSSGTSLNITLNPLSIKSDENVEKLAALVEGYFAMGGRQVQFNPMGRETLKDAQQNPEHYPDLMVKVSGYSYRFVDLSKGLQDDIIARTEFDIC
jgi:formate C-acetyltransferase